MIYSFTFREDSELSFAGPKSTPKTGGGSRKTDR